MSNDISVKPNQSILDVILQSCGSMESGMQMMLVNNRSISDIPAIGDQIVIDDGNLGEPGTLLYLQQNNIVIGTLGNKPATTLDYRIVLYPQMKVQQKSAILPPTLGHYNFEMVADIGFTNVYDIAASAFPSQPNTFDYQTLDEFTAGDPYGSTGSYVPTVSMPPEEIEYRIPWNPGHEEVMVWTDLSVDITALTFEDVNGNRACVAPAVVVRKNTQDIIEAFTPEISVELITADSTTATLRLTMSHGATHETVWNVIGMYWLDEAASGIPDPDDPSNPDKTIVTLGSGIHTFGALTQYGPSLISSWPAYSLIEMVIEIA